MKPIDSLETDNPQVALIVAAYNAAAVHPTQPYDPFNTDHKRRYEQQVPDFIERFDRIYRAMASSVGGAKVGGAPSGEGASESAQEVDPSPALVTPPPPPGAA